MRIFKNILRTVKICWDDISFKDKGLIIIMSILLMQCIHNLYNGDHMDISYEGINIVVRTSVAGIFGYFVSSNFLAKAEEDINDNKKCELKYLEELLEDEEIQQKINLKYKVEKIEEEKEQERYLCNKNLQNIIAISMCVIMLLSLIIGVNFGLLPKTGTAATVSQIRDLISGCIGFLIGNTSKGDKK